MIVSILSGTSASSGLRLDGRVMATFALIDHDQVHVVRSAVVHAGRRTIRVTAWQPSK